MRSYGPVALIGSGETAANGGQAFEALARNLPVPLKTAVLETPAGFEVNSAQVAGRVADFLRLRLQNYHPQVEIIAARKKGTPNSPDEPGILRSLSDRDLIFLGPGSPTYAVRQLADSLAWQIVQARHRLGAGLALASAAAIAVGRLALPVYEIYKVGEDPVWKPGLDLFRPWGLSLAIIPHWNNQDGGEELDTSRCFMGRERFTVLHDLLPADVTLVGIDEHTSLLLSFEEATCRVTGQGGVLIFQAGEWRAYPAGEEFPIARLGPYNPPRKPDQGLPAHVWEMVLKESSPTPELQAPPEVQRLADERQEARLGKEWAKADKLRERIDALGWIVQDTESGPVLTPKK